MILSLSGLCLENLPEGLLRRTTIDGARARSLIKEAAAADRLIGIFEFGPTPDPRDRKTFHQLLAALHDVHDIELGWKDFHSEIKPDDEGLEGEVMGYPNPLQIFRADEGRPILVVGYVFSPGEGDLLDMDVATDRLTFDLIEVVSDAGT